MEAVKLERLFHIEGARNRICGYDFTEFLLVQRIEAVALVGSNIPAEDSGIDRWEPFPSGSSSAYAAGRDSPATAVFSS